MGEKLTVNQRTILAALDDPDSWCFPFAAIGERAQGFPQKLIRRTVRALARKGFAELHRGLWNDDGEMGGSGYCITPAGRAALKANT